MAHPERRQIEVVVDRGHGGDEEGTCGGKGGWQKPLSGPPRHGERPRAEGTRSRVCEAGRALRSSGERRGGGSVDLEGLGAGSAPILRARSPVRACR